MAEKNNTVDLRKDLYKQMVLSRKFEEKIVELHNTSPDKLPGMQILAVGQEAVAAGVVSALMPEDVIVSNHRSHAHLLSRGADPNTLMAEIMGKVAGVNKGKAGTLHLSVPEVNCLMTSTVVGAGPPLAVGAAFAQKYRGDNHITVVFFGDGAAAEGSVHEAMNLAALWKLPVLFVCENNGWAGAQKPSEHCPIPNISKRGEAYGMPGESVDGNDVEKVRELAVRMAAHCRSGEGPALMEAMTYRMRGHGERDHQHYVDRKEIEYWAERCPIKHFRGKLLESGDLNQDDLQDIDHWASDLVESAVKYADDSPYPTPESALSDVWVQFETA